MRKRIPDGFGGDAAEDRLGTALVFCGFTFVLYEHFTRHRVAIWHCNMGLWQILVWGIGSNVYILYIHSKILCQRLNVTWGCLETWFISKEIPSVFWSTMRDILIHCCDIFMKWPILFLLLLNKPFCVWASFCSGPCWKRCTWMPLPYATNEVGIGRYIHPRAGEKTWKIDKTKGRKASIYCNDLMHVLHYTIIILNDILDMYRVYPFLNLYDQSSILPCFLLNLAIQETFIV